MYKLYNSLNKLNLWPFYHLTFVTLTFNLSEQMFQITNCAKLFWNRCINVQVIVWTSSIYDHLLIWLSSLTLTFNLPEQMVLLLIDNNCAKLFWNPWTNVQVMVQTTSVYKYFIIWPSSVTMTFNLPEQMFQMALLLLKDNNCAKLLWN